MKITTLALVASLTLSVTHAAFATQVASETLASPAPGDQTFNVSGTGISGSLTLDSSSGNWDPTDSPTDSPSTAFPVVSYNLTIDGITFNNTLSADSIPSNANIDLVWTSTGISTIELGIIDSDPWSGDFNGLGGFDLYNDIGGLPDLSNTPFYSGSASWTAAVPDSGSSWVLLAGVCAALGAYQISQRRGAKLV